MNDKWISITYIQGSYGQDKVRISQDFDLLGQDKTGFKKSQDKVRILTSWGRYLPKYWVF